MTTIKRLYIPHIEKNINTEYIANVFSKNGLAQINQIYLKSNYKYNSAYIEIKFWYKTPAAYSFIERLSNPNTEVRLIYSDDNWWVVKINKCPTKYNVNNTILSKKDNYVIINATKTKLLRDIINNFKENKERELMEKEDFDEEIIWKKNKYFMAWLFQDLPCILDQIDHIPIDERYLYENLIVC